MSLFAAAASRVHHDEEHNDAIGKLKARKADWLCMGCGRRNSSERRKCPPPCRRWKHGKRPTSANNKSKAGKKNPYADLKQRDKPRITSKHQCGHCAACMVDDCGECRFCLDMPKFGGSGTQRQKCVKRPPCETYSRGTTAFKRPFLRRNLVALHALAKEKRTSSSQSASKVGAQQFPTRLSLSKSRPRTQTTPQRAKEASHSISSPSSATATLSSLSSSTESFKDDSSRKDATYPVPKGCSAEDLSLEEIHSIYLKKKRQRDEAIVAAESLPFEVLEGLYFKQKRIRSTIDLTIEVQGPVAPDGSGRALQNAIKTAQKYSASLVQVKKEMNDAEESLKEIRGNLDDANELMEQQTLTVDVWQSRFDELSKLALEQGLDAQKINEIRNRPLSSGR